MSVSQHAAVHITSIHLKNYASFVDTGEVSLSKGVNIFVGANNSGKSALLRSLVNPLSDNPNKIETRKGSEAKSSIEINIEASLNEIFDRTTAIPKVVNFPFRGNDPQGSDLFLQETIANPDRPISLSGIRVAGQSIASVSGGSIDELRDPSNQMYMQVRRNGTDFIIQGRSAGVDSLVHFLDNPDSRSIFFFGPQRVNIGRVTISDEFILKSDASNLPTVLSNIQNTLPATFERLERHLSEITPGIERITVRPSGGVFEIMLWPERVGEFSDINFSVEQSGSGIAQLLAILSAIVLHKNAIIIIDEINTHLHPAAIKKLFRIIQSDYSGHQYIISAHSPDVIFSSGPSKIFSVRREGLSSLIQPVAMKTAEDAREVAGLLGFSMLDVFGNERIVWVEGPTEEVLFPYLLEQSGEPLPPEIGICSVGATAGFSASETRRNEILAIYENAGKRLAPLLLGMAFGLDRESLSDESVKSFESSKRKLRFLPRRCVENYLLSADSIAAVLNNLGESVSSEDVEAELVKVAKDTRFSAAGNGRGVYNSETWLRWVDGARLLSHLFETLSATRLEFRKTRDVLSLAKARQATEPESLEELRQFVANLVRIAQRDTKP